jgi:hypothetical protein
MAWKTLDATSHKGIRVTFKNGKDEDFIHYGGYEFSAQVWGGTPEDTQNGELSIGYWDSEGVWVRIANFQPGAYDVVRILLS